MELKQILRCQNCLEKLSIERNHIQHRWVMTKRRGFEEDYTTCGGYATRFYIDYIPINETGY